MSNADQDTDTVTAYHEAGHAVVGYALGGEIESIGLYAEADEWLPERFGDCHVNWGRVDPSTNWQRQREILTILAGPVAEGIYRGESMHPALYPPWRHDWDFAIDRLDSVASLERRKTILSMSLTILQRQLQEDACWAAVAAVADELLAHEYVDGEHLADTLTFWLG
ncbi:MAG: cell division protein FtsH [Planctomycetota bacterium]